MPATTFQERLERAGFDRERLVEALEYVHDDGRSK
jgi:hypothetical protein